MADLARNLTIILLVGSTLAGCSKKEESAASDAAVATESAALDSKAIHTNAAKNPEQLVSTQQSALEQSRQLVKSAQLQFEVQDVLKPHQPWNNSYCNTMATSKRSRSIIRSVTVPSVTVLMAVSTFMKRSRQPYSSPYASPMTKSQLF